MVKPQISAPTSPRPPRAPEPLHRVTGRSKAEPLTVIKDLKGGTKLMQIEIHGPDAIKVAQDIVATDGVQGTYEVVSEVEREGTLATIATIIGITTGAMTIAEKLYELNKKSVNSPESVKIERVLLVGKNGDRLLLKDATL